jgi:hypothetical protein
MSNLFRLWFRPTSSAQQKTQKPRTQSHKWRPIYGPASEQACEAEFHRLLGVPLDEPGALTGDWLVLVAARDANDNTRPTR